MASEKTLPRSRTKTGVFLSAGTRRSDGIRIQINQVGITEAAMRVVAGSTRSPDDAYVQIVVEKTPVAQDAGPTVTIVAQFVFIGLFLAVIRIKMPAQDVHIF
jgi:hypothetical protein